MSTNHRKEILILLLAIAGSLVLAAIVLGQVGGTLDLNWSTIAAGGGGSVKGRYFVDDSLGQPVASGATSAAGDRYTLTDGFIQVGSTETRVYLPLVSSSNS